MFLVQIRFKSTLKQDLLTLKNSCMPHLTSQHLVIVVGWGVAK